VDELIHGLCKSVCRLREHSLRSGGEADLPASDAEAVFDETSYDGKKKLTEKKRNAVAMASLMMTFTSETLSMGLVCKAMTDEWPGRLVHLVVDAL
jgi:hypothetical protein